MENEAISKNDLKYLEAKEFIKNLSQGYIDFILENGSRPLIGINSHLINEGAPNAFLTVQIPDNPLHFYISYRNKLDSKSSSLSEIEKTFSDDEILMLKHLLEADIRANNMGSTYIPENKSPQDYVFTEGYNETSDKAANVTRILELLSISEDNKLTHMIYKSEDSKLVIYKNYAETEKEDYNKTIDEITISMSENYILNIEIKKKDRKEENYSIESIGQSPISDTNLEIIRHLLEAIDLMVNSPGY